MKPIIACPAGWLLEALVGHPLDAVLFPRRTLWWRYWPDAWRIAERPTAPTGERWGAIRRVCDCEARPLLKVTWPPPTGKIFPEDMATFHQVDLQCVQICRDFMVPMEPWARLPGQQCTFWAGRCPWCKAIDWTLSPWRFRK